MILGDVLPGHVVEVNESPKSHTLPGEMQKDDCHSGLLVRWLRIMRWLGKVQEKILNIAPIQIKELVLKSLVYRTCY